MDTIITDKPCKIRSQNMTNFSNYCALNYKELIIDEIALEGLQGINIEYLWKHMEKHVGTTLTPKIKEKFWKFISSTESISVYIAPEQPPVINIIDRFMIVDEATGYIVDPKSPLDGPYEWCPVENEYGSCSNYTTRTLISKNDIQSLGYEEVKVQYGGNLLLVASIEARWHALASHLPFTYLSQLTPIHYGLLELIGKGRENGQMTVGTTNLTKIVKEPKLLFYNRNALHKLDLIKVHHTKQIIGSKAVKSILLQLKRFHQPVLGGRLPKIGMIANTVEYLLSQPDYSEINDVIIKKGFMTRAMNKRFQKTSCNIFRFEDREIERTTQFKGDKQKTTIKKRFIVLDQNCDDPQTDEESEAPSLKCQYKIGVGIMRQAYERILDAGLKGLTQADLAYLLGVEFYTSRSLCRTLKTKNLVREFLEDKGRQRTARYIAVAATKEIDKEYDKEKSILLEHVQNTKDTSVVQNSDSDSESDVPIKKLKLDEESKKEEKDSIENFITELKALEGCETVKQSVINAKKTLTLRQLKFANGILQILRESKCIVGFQMLGMLVSKRINEPPMDNKCLKLFVHKLMTDGQLKVFKISKPNKFYLVICAPNIKTTDAIIKKKFKELCCKPEPSKNITNTKIEDARPKWQFIYQRYIKIQKLHELLTKFVYFNTKSETSPTPGFTSLLSVMPEMTIEFALSNINNLETSDVARLKINDKLKAVKIQEAPLKLKNAFLESRSLQNSLKVILKILAALGLIQLVHDPTSSSARKQSNKSCIFYVNRKAKILDTTGKWPRPDDNSVIEKSFKFETFDDVKNYWLTVTKISSNTTVNVQKRESLKLAHPMRSSSEIELYDTGDRLGDGLGPCGFDSSIFMDIPRLWRKFVFQTPNVQLTVPAKRKARRIIVKKTSNPKISVKKDRRRRTAETPLTWTSFEDKILMLCQAAITVLSPSSQPGALKLRNNVARYLLTMSDPKKTAAWCHKRAMILESNSIMSYERDCIINELRRRRDLVQKYDGLLKILRLRHVGSMNKYIKEASIPLLELVWLASQIEKAKPYIQRIPCIALNFEDFNKNYTIAQTTSSRPYNVYRTPTTREPEFAALKEGILLSVMLSFKNPVSKETAQKIYSIFEVYPESTLRSAVQELRKCGALSARQKTLNNKVNKVNFDDIVESAYKISAGYTRKWINRLEPDFIDNVADLLYGTVAEKGLKGNSALNCFFCELNTCDVLDIKSDTIPVVTGSAGSIMQEEQMNVIDMETKYQLKSGTVGWKNKKNIDVFSEYFKEVNYKSSLDMISKASVVKFSDNDIIYDMQDPIISYLEEKGEKGSTFQELQQHLSMDRNFLCKRLKELESKTIVKRVGFYENLIMLTKNVVPMMLQVGLDVHIIPTPWLTLDGQIQIEIFIKWTNVIVSKVFETPGCSIEFLSHNFECISTRSVQDICIFLLDCECVTMHCIEKIPVDLFSEDDDIAPNLTDYNPYDSPDNILVFPVKNVLTKYANSWKKIMTETESKNG